MTLEGKDVLSTVDMKKEEIVEVLQVSTKMEEIVKKDRVSTLLQDKVVAVLFLEPSTRTRLSFEAAVKRLGAKAVTVSDAKTSSGAKGETLADMAKTVAGYVDCIVVRQPAIGGAEVMADAGLDDILIPYNLVGASKLRRAVDLARRVKLTLTCDSVETAEGLSQAFESAGLSAALLVECDTGAARCGVQVR